MKRRMLSMLLAMCLLLTLLPVTAMASPIEDTYGVTVSSVSDLEEIMNDPETANHDDIWVDTENFLWDCGDDKVVIIDFLSNETTDYRDFSLNLMGSWTIPADITVICYENIYYPDYPSDASITINGTWIAKDRSYFNADSYTNNKMVINGSFTGSDKSSTSLEDVQVTLNGTFCALNGCNLGKLTVNSGANLNIADSSYNYMQSLTLADGVKLKGRSITLAGDLTVNGSAVIENDIWLVNGAAFTGNLELGRVRITANSSTNSGELTIPAGSVVSINALDCSNGQVINVEGTLSLVYAMKAMTFDNSTIHLTGTMKLIDGISLGNESSNSSVTGNGRLELYASYMVDHPASQPEIFGSKCETDADVPASIIKDITIWRNWEDCAHSWGAEVREEPTCGTDGSVRKTCAKCGTENVSQRIPETGEHVPTVTADSNSTNRAKVSCSVCERSGNVYIYGFDCEYTGKPAEGAVIEGSLVNPEDVIIVYTNNDKIGTATASATIGGVTISTTFEIVDCVHEAETPATCQSLAVCGKCGKTYGELGNHVWSGEITAGEKTHYFACTVEGCGYTSSEEEFYEMLDPSTLENWEIIASQLEIYNLSILDHISEEGKTECLICGSGKSSDHPSGGVVGNNIQEPGETKRVYGATRYETSISAADTLKENLGVEKFDAVIVASGTNFADALAGSYLAAMKHAPILITKSSTMDSVKAYIRENLKSGGTVYLLGGPVAVGTNMEKGLDGFQVKRLAGNTRYETNLAILKEAGVEGKDIIVCTGKDFADSLSASAVGLPILLVKDSLTAAQKEFLTGTGANFIIVGGKNAVNTTIEKNLKTYGSVKRLAGNTRYETSVLVAQEFFEAPSTAVLAYAQNFPDGLCGGPLAYSMGAPLLLTAGGKQSVAVKYTESLGIETGLILGGTTLINDKVAESIF